MRKILWLMPNKAYNKTGIYKYNYELIKVLKSTRNIDIKYCGLSDNYLETFFSKFIILPIYLIILSIKYDCIVYPEEGFAFLKLFSLSKKNKIIIHDYRYEFNRYLNLKFKEKLKQSFLNLNFLFLKNFTKIIVPSKFTKNILIKNFNKINIKKIIIIPNIIEIKKSNYKSLGNKFKILKKIKKNSKIILTISSNESRKNIELIFKLSNINKKLNFVLIGNFKKKLHSNIYIFENLTELELSKIYNISDIYFDTSLYEGFGRTTIEAQNFKLPVVCFNTDSNKEILKDTCHFIKKSDSLEKIIKKLINLKISSKDKNKIFKNANRYSSKKVQSKYKLNINEI